MSETLLRYSVAEKKRRQEFALKALLTSYAGGGQTRQLKQMLMSFDFLHAKIYKLGTQPLIDDYSLVSPAGNVALTHLKQMLMQTSHLLEQCEEAGELANTLYTRLFYINDVTDPINEQMDSLPSPYLTLLHPMPDIPNPTQLRTLFLRTPDPIYDCVISPDGKFIIASDGSTIKAWNIATGELQLNLIGHRDEVLGCAISENGLIIVSASRDTTLKVWNVATKSEQMTLVGRRLTPKVVPL